MRMKADSVGKFFIACLNEGNDIQTDNFDDKIFEKTKLFKEYVSPVLIATGLLVEDQSTKNASPDVGNNTGKRKPISKQDSDNKVQLEDAPGKEFIWTGRANLNASFKEVCESHFNKHRRMKSFFNSKKTDKNNSNYISWNYTQNIPYQLYIKVYLDSDKVISHRAIFINLGVHNISDIKTARGFKMYRDKTLVRSYITAFASMAGIKNDTVYKDFNSIFPE